jgi:hypothetical protein
VEREAARRSQKAGEGDAQNRRNNVQHRRTNGLRDSWKRTGGGKPRTKGKAARAGYERRKSSESQHRVAKGAEDTNREFQRKLAVVTRDLSKILALTDELTKLTAKLKPEKLCECGKETHRGKVSGGGGKTEDSALQQLLDNQELLDRLASMNPSQKPVGNIGGSAGIWAWMGPPTVTRRATSSDPTVAGVAKKQAVGRNNSAAAGATEKAVGDDKPAAGVERKQAAGSNSVAEVSTKQAAEGTNSVAEVTTEQAAEGTNSAAGVWTEQAT